MLLETWIKYILNTLIFYLKAELETGTENEDEKPTIKLEDSEERRIILGASSPSAFSSTQNSQMGEGKLIIGLKFCSTRHCRLFQMPLKHLVEVVEMKV